ncbi:hypothetical protein A3K48_04110 [candidate division WOR-1 bacterium RIFOXYA12_FULL_52_29]|uniref:Metallo-beta-lactamase domain-containing protein n=1 Tax=candidate division WOR-1 bacterium RIFOXYC12_FULL_54_18 TaxID=1802584 RepID=A0A1F4T5T6_UNCSA|nr:MAG: hypothetical protein A3K44_04110 [candidate division WOR-1 bacterium RIFOXYA2_FULL_51_19]OGC17738.1 MAG: hypothetical protein A3K48_04110 [candidate division WOR-1 bacterium RIFOXYA12_FULL_52_29]OGC26595.1 MAG: hypothetical protein A3K32_04105 [candidate division WOR-1 bacterium RIFOXYB2_FULL_45_9]OGC28155.1 MAG: hypothetical protein A3K49_04110 [candidate division WOR-1 bacterium RIFOXYC12_FULL_54_18]OGC29559.1 MAG: hypothetical protein A2346_02225 [candidate division WOR-1 bacterium R
MKFEVKKVGPISANCYVVWDEPTKEALIIDPGDDSGSIIKIIAANQLSVKAIVNTHGHFDHVGSNGELKQATGAKLMQHPLDAKMARLTDPTMADEMLEDGGSVTIGQSHFKVIHTPGHSPGGICLYNEEEKVLFSGDTLFLGTYGRVDLPNSSAPAMAASLKRLFALPPETIVCPGHGRPTTIGDAKKAIDLP